MHPGVIDSGLTVVPTAPLSWLKSKLLISPDQGARMPLYAATEPDVKGLTMYHNILGIVPTSKETYDHYRAAAHWELSMQLCEEGLKKPLRNRGGNQQARIGAGTGGGVNARMPVADGSRAVNK